MNIIKQLLLPLFNYNDKTFDSFIIGKNKFLFTAIQSTIQQTNTRCLYVWSLDEGSGKSHLLHAACNYLSNKGKAVSFVPLDSYNSLIPAILEGMENLSLVCLDNIQCIARKKNWEIALFNLYNRILETKKTILLITADNPPKLINLFLPDLISRLEKSQIYKLYSLNDENKILALQLRAKIRGFELSEEVGRFVLKRLDRKTRTLFSILNELEYASIIAQRKLTIPFVKNILHL